MMGLDRLDTRKLALLMDQMNELEDNSVVVRTCTLDLYGEHRVRLARKGGRWGTLRITKIERLP